VTGNLKLQPPPRGYEQIRELVLTDWDPIGVREISGAEDEYDAYVPEIYSLLLKRTSSDEVFSYLWQLETEHMGLQGDKTATKKFVQTLMALM